MARYRAEPERILLEGLGDLAAVRRRRKRICTSRRYKYQWLKIDPCIELPDVDEEEVPNLRSSRDVSTFLHDTVPFAGRGVEFFMVVIANSKLSPIAVAVPHRGGRNSSVVDVGVVYQAVLLAGGTSFFVAHNHPSETPSPSSEDVSMTKKIKNGAALIGLQFLDHIIVTNDPKKYFSFLDAGLLSG